MWEDYQMLQIEVVAETLLPALSTHIGTIAVELLTKKNVVFCGVPAVLMCCAVLTTISAVDPLTTIVQLDRVRGQLKEPSVPTSRGH